ncbi:MAG: hypothetical protein H7306_08210 [Bacteriovorax sp.]|nr:hypothetical protein [Rhizobacter sp.]
MNSSLESSASGMRLTGLVTLLALVSAVAVAGCHSNAVARLGATTAPIKTSQAAPAPALVSPPSPMAATLPNPLLGMEPVLPFDEKQVTPMETVGAPDKD